MSEGTALIIFFSFFSNPRETYLRRSFSECPRVAMMEIWMEHKSKIYIYTIHRRRMIRATRLIDLKLTCLVSVKFNPQISSSSYL